MSGTRPPHATATAGEYVVTRVPTASPDQAAAQVLAALAGERFDSADLIFVLAPDRRLLGFVPMARLLHAAPSGATMAAIMTAAPASVPPQAEQESVAMLALHHDLAAVPVCDEAGRFVGVVPAVALLRILREEGVEDIHRMAGLIHPREHAFAALCDEPLRHVWQRLPWLLVGLIGAVCATAIMTGFEDTLKAQLSVAYFVPAIVYLADAIGTQSEAAAVRRLAFVETDFAALVKGETVTGAVIGVILGLAAFGLVWLGFGGVALAAAVGLALFAAGTAAGIIGILLPVAFDRLGTDPAYASGPVGTIIQDVLTLLIYFGVVQALLL